MKAFYWLHGLATILITGIILVLVNFQSAQGFLAGAVLSVLNVIVIHYVWSRVIGKKSVAWPFTVIVLKYTLLIAVLYQVVLHKPFSVLWFGLGLGSIMIAAVIYAVRIGRKSGGDTF